MLLAEAQTVLMWLFGFSFVTFVAGLFLLPLMVVRIPSDYFACERPPRLQFERHHPALRMTLLAAKNLVGLALTITGLIMLVTPGPGIVALIVGISLMDIPGKRALERKIISLPAVFEGLNRLRARYGRPPLERPIPRLTAPAGAP
jgi:Putative transmembrane protein (PGPGW)